VDLDRRSGHAGGGGSWLRRSSPPMFAAPVKTRHEGTSYTATRRNSVRVVDALTWRQVAWRPTCAGGLWPLRPRRWLLRSGIGAEVTSCALLFRVGRSHPPWSVASTTHVELPTAAPLSARALDYPVTLMTLI